MVLNLLKLTVERVTSVSIHMCIWQLAMHSKQWLEVYFVFTKSWNSYKNCDSDNKAICKQNYSLTRISDGHHKSISRYHHYMGGMYVCCWSLIWSRRQSIIQLQLVHRCWRVRFFCACLQMASTNLSLSGSLPWCFSTKAWNAIRDFHHAAPV